jgi:hypothetical protein
MTKSWETSDLKLLLIGWAETDNESCANSESGSIITNPAFQGISSFSSLVIGSCVYFGFETYVSESILSGGGWGRILFLLLLNLPMNFIKSSLLK